MKNNIWTIIGLLVISTFFNPVFSQDSLTLESCRNQAIAHNKQIKIAAYQKDEAAAYQKVARTSYLPALSADASLMFISQDINVSIPAGAYMATAVSEEAAQNGEFNGIAYAPQMDILNLDNITLINGGLSLTQPIYVGGKIRYSNKKSDLGVEMAENSYNMKYDEIVELTDQAFWQVASIEANIELAESYIKMLKDLEDQMNRMYELGLTPQSEKLKVSVQKNDAELQLLKAKNGLKVAKMYLNQIIGRDLESEVNIAFNVSEIDITDMTNGIRMALDNRSELKLVENQVEMAEYDKRLALSDYLPTIGVQAQYSTYYVNDLYEDGGFNPTVSGQISIPIFAWGQGKQKQKAADFAIKRRQEELNRTTELVSLEVMRTMTQLEEAFEEIDLAKKNIAEAQTSLDETKASFEVGLNSTTDLLNAQADWQKSKSNLISAIARYKVLETSWKKVTGTITR